MILESNCDSYRNKIESMIRILATQAPELEDIPCTFAVVADAEKDARLGELNGLLSPPKVAGLPFTILVADRQFKDDSYVHTVTHELMHLIDYSAFIRDFGNPYEKSPEELKKLHHLEFLFWMEFHARHVGVGIYWMATWVERGYEIPTDGPWTVEVLDWQTKSLEEPLDLFLAGRSSTGANDLLWNLIRALIDYYARINLAEGVDINSIPDPTFPRDKLVKALGEPALELFPLLKRMRFYGEAIPLLPALSAIFDKIVTKLNAESPWSALRAIQFDQFSAVQDQMRKLVESIVQTPPMTDAVKSIIQSMSALSVPKSIAQSLSMADALKSWADSIPSFEKLMGSSHKKADDKPKG